MKLTISFLIDFVISTSRSGPSVVCPSSFSTDLVVDVAETFFPFGKVGSVVEDANLTCKCRWTMAACQLDTNSLEGMDGKLFLCSDWEGLELMYSALLKDDCGPQIG
jgi:hypothetical protein